MYFKVIVSFILNGIQHKQMLLWRSIPCFFGNKWKLFLSWLLKISWVNFCFLASASVKCFNVPSFMVLCYLLLQFMIKVFPLLNRHWLFLFVSSTFFCWSCVVVLSHLILRFVIHAKSYKQKHLLVWFISYAYKLLKLLCITLEWANCSS